MGRATAPQIIAPTGRLALVLAVLVVACGELEPETQEVASAAALVTASGSAGVGEGGGTTKSASALGDEADWRRCAERRRATLAQPTLPGAPAFEADRAAMVVRVRGATVLWKREPQHDPAAGSRDAVRDFERSRKPLGAIRKLLRKHRKKPALLRQALLREGYLYASDVEHALALVQQVGLTSLFTEPTLFLLRDGAVQRLRREGRGREARYLHQDGPLAGERAEILLADRVGLDRDTILHEPLAVDFGAAQEAFGFDRIRAAHLTAATLAAEVRYGSHWVPALFDVSAAKARLLCHELSSLGAAAAQQAQTQAMRSVAVQARIREVALAQVREGLPFDAPRGGLPDSEDRFPLRQRWQDAYDRSRRSFRYGGKRYQVYDEQGRPLPPQVCIDFIYDTWERAGGSWFAPMRRRDGDGPLEPAPGRDAGTVSVGALGLEQRRRVSRFLRFAEEHPDHFDVWKVPVDERVVYAEHDRFIAYLVAHADQLKRGDMLVVRRPKFDGRALHHTMIIIELDPFIGVPSLLVANAARPLVQTFEGVMQITPRRFLQYRIRPRPQWLDEAVLRATSAP